MSRKVTEAGKQFFKCANNSKIQLIGLTDYDCPLWNKSDSNIKGSFDESGYKIYHIIEHSLTHKMIRMIIYKHYVKCAIVLKLNVF